MCIYERNRGLGDCAGRIEMAHEPTHLM